MGGLNAVFVCVWDHYLVSTYRRCLPRVHVGGQQATSHFDVKPFHNKIKFDSAQILSQFNITFA